MLSTLHSPSPALFLPSLLPTLSSGLEPSWPGLCRVPAARAGKEEQVWKRGWKEDYRSKGEWGGHWLGGEEEGGARAERKRATEQWPGASQRRAERMPRDGVIPSAACSRDLLDL